MGQKNRPSDSRFRDSVIYDKIDNIETYIGLSEDIRKGLEWLFCHIVPPRRAHATVMCEWASEGEESGCESENWRIIR